MAAEEKVHLPVALDLMGPRYRLGQIPDEPRMLKADQEVVLGPDGAELPSTPTSFSYIEPGERVLIDGGLIELRIESKQGDRVIARVINGGPVKTRKGINLPDSALPFEISEKDRSDIAFAVAENADFLARATSAKAPTWRPCAPWPPRPAGASRSSPRSSAPPPSSTWTTSPRRPTA